MKIKCQPQDFYVEEIVNIPWAQNGNYAIYKLEKKYWDTFDLLDYLTRKYHIKNIGRAGIKDRYCHSVQYISVRDFKKPEVIEKNFKLTLVGKAQQPITINHLIKNLFKITIRDLNEKELAYLNQNLNSIKQYGLINYYDEQRMGSARAKQGFIAEKLVKRHYNGALKLYLATPSKFDDQKTRKLKKHMFENWGNWQKCLNAPYDLHQYRYPLLYLLDHPKDFKGAIKTIRKDLLEMFINAYQAFIWNETVKALIKSLNLADVICKYRFGELYFYQQLTDAQLTYLKTLTIPAPSYKTSFSDAKIKNLMSVVLAKDNLQLSDLKLDLGIKGIFFKPYLRNAIVFLDDIKLSEPSPDEQYPKKYKLSLEFSLPKGSYATILIKRLTKF
ncbi:MAG: tRNA pseudouridine(13) synthase TruD [candidate division WOR-3 bacterium]